MSNGPTLIPAAAVTLGVVEPGTVFTTVYDGSETFFMAMEYGNPARRVVRLNGKFAGQCTTMGVDIKVTVVGKFKGDPKEEV